ncbi:MAG: hypothetical protein U1E50_07965 [Caulobacteraceae bacterium]
MIDLVKAYDWKGVRDGLEANPALMDWRDERGRNWLHLLCATPPNATRLAHDSVRTAEVLRRAGFDVSAPAFMEGDWKATPVWFTVSRGENLTLTRWLLNEGADPNHSLWAAGFKDDLEAMRLLVRFGADIDPVTEQETPFLGAIKTSHFKGAAELLRLGADVNFIDHHGMTALHYMLKKDSDKAHFGFLIAAGAKGDIRGPDGKTAREIMRRKKDPDFQRMAEMLA